MVASTPVKETVIPEAPQFSTPQPSEPQPVFISVKTLGEPIDEVEETPVSVKVESLSSPQSASPQLCAPQPKTNASSIHQRFALQCPAPQKSELGVFACPPIPE